MPGRDAVTSAAPDSVVVAKAPLGEIVFSNRYAERAIGRTLSELADDFPIFHLDGRPYEFAERQVPRSLSGEEIVDEEFLGPDTGAGQVHYRCTCWPVYDDDGQIVAAVAVTRDVTVQTRRQERLGYLAGLLENTDDAVVAMDQDYLLTVWNRGAERLFGWSADEVLGRRATEVARTNLSDARRRRLRRELVETGRWRGELAVERKDGGTVEVEMVSVALRDAGGDITGYLAIHRDITERTRTDEALRAAQRQRETILESITDAFVAVDAQWRFTYVNERALRRMQGRSGKALTREDVLGRGMWELFPEAKGSTFERRYHEAMRERRALEFETYFAPSDEWIEAHVYPSGSGLAIYYRDVSERNHADGRRESRARQQGAVADLGLRALTEDDIQALMDETVALVAQILDVELAGVTEIASHGEEAILRAGVGFEPGIVGRRLGREVDASLMGYTLRTRGPVVSQDVAADERFKASSIVRDHAIVSALCVVIATRDEPFGVLGALSTHRRTFSQSDVSFLQSVANVLASAVEHTRAQRQLQEVREVERRRLARDLHDEAPQEREQEDRTAIDSLTPRELEVLQALGEGLDSQAIADRLHISVRTERNHVASILAKLGVHSRLQALVFAIRHGIVDVR